MLKPITFTLVLELENLENFQELQELVNEANQYFGIVSAEIDVPEGTKINLSSTV